MRVPDDFIVQIENDTLYFGTVRSTESLDECNNKQSRLWALWDLVTTSASGTVFRRALQVGVSRQVYLLGEEAFHQRV